MRLLDFYQRNTTLPLFKLRHEAPALVFLFKLCATLFEGGIQTWEVLSEFVDRAFHDIVWNEEMFLDISLFEYIASLTCQNNKLTDDIFSA